ncbi:hypothetical protein D3C72_2294400 [compost metagenome]
MRNVPTIFNIVCGVLVTEPVWADSTQAIGLTDQILSLLMMPTCLHLCGLFSHERRGILQDHFYLVTHRVGIEPFPLHGVSVRVRHQRKPFCLTRQCG